jgi:soluble cytochrome b562
MKVLHARAVADATAIVSSAANARAKTVVGELAAMRKSLDAASQSIEKLLVSPIQVDAEITAFVEGLARHVEALAKPAGDMEGLQKQLQERETQNQELRKLLVKARMDLEAARAELEAAQAELAT